MRPNSATATVLNTIIWITGLDAIVSFVFGAIKRSERRVLFLK